MFYKANMKFDEMKNYAVSHSDKENIFFEAMQQQEPYDNNATQYLFVDSTFFDLFNDDYNRYYEQEIYYDCQSNYAEDEPMYCQNLCKRQPLRMSEVLNEIVQPKEFKKVLKQMSLNSNRLYRSFRQAYRRAKKTRKSSTKTSSGLKCKCLKCGGAKCYDEFLIQMNEGDMNPWDINSVELPPYQQETGKIGDGIEVGRNKQNIDVQNDIETYCMWLNQKHSKCCRSWESHSMKTKNFPPANNQTIDNWLHQTPSCPNEIYVCNKTDVQPKEMPHTKGMEQEPDENDKLSEYVTYSCTHIASTKTVNEPEDDEISKIMPICLMIPLNIKIDSQEEQLLSSGVEFMTETSKAKQNQIFVAHENTMECSVPPAKPRTIQERIDNGFDAFAGATDVQQTEVAKEIEFTREMQPCNINPQSQQAIQIGQQAIKPKAMDPKPVNIALVTNVTSSVIKVDTKQSKEIQKQPTKDNQSCHLNETAQVPSPVDTTTEQLPSASKSNLKSIEMKMDSRQQSPKVKQSCTCIKIAIPTVSITTTDHQNDVHSNAEKIQEFQSPKILKNTLASKSVVQENKLIKSCPCSEIVNPPVPVTTPHLQNDLHTNAALQPPKTLNKSESLQPESGQEIKSTRSCPCTKIGHAPHSLTHLRNEKIQELQPPNILNQPEQITESLQPDTEEENKSTTVQTQALHEPVYMPEDKIKLVHKPLPTIYETMPLTISESQQFDRQPITEIVQTNISTVQHYKRKTMSMELQQVSDSKEIPTKATETSRQSVTESVQTDISSIQHYKRKEMRTEIQHELEELLQPNPSTSKQIYDSDERDEILLDLHRLFHPEKAGIQPDDLSRQKALRDLNYIVKPETEPPTGLSTSNSKLPESQDSILAGIRHMLSPQPASQEKTKRRKYHKQAKEKILEDLQIFLKPVKAKPPANKTLRNSVLSDLRFMLVTGEDKSPANMRPRHSFSSHRRPSTSSDSSIIRQPAPRPPEVIRECIITDCRYLPNSTSHLDKETIDDLETAAQFYQRQLGFENHSAIFFQGPL